MNMMVSTAIAGTALASRSAEAAPASPTDRRALEAYASWLFMERRILCGELWPHMGAKAEKWDWHDNAGAGWHFRDRGALAWDEGPQPSSRAAAVLDLVGVDWRQPKEDLGLDHTDTGARPPLPAGWPAPDGELLELAEQFHVAESECGRLNSISDEMDGHRKISPPETLKVRDGDCNFGLPELNSDARYPGFYGANEVNKMRPQKWLSVTKAMHDDGESFTLTAQYSEPSPEARARADEIVASYDKWEKKVTRRPNGFRAAMRATDKAFERTHEIEEWIVGTPATTIAGMIAKARCEKRVSCGQFADSIVADLLAIAGETQATA